MKKVLIIDEVHPTLEKELKKYGFLVEKDLQLPKSLFLKKIIDFEGLVMRSRFTFFEKDLFYLKHLKFMARVGSGMEHIDKLTAYQYGIKLISSPEGNAHSVGEHTLLLLLSLLKNLKPLVNIVASKQWERNVFEGNELRNKIVGIIGYGNTGASFAKVLSGIGSKILAYDKYKSNFSNQYVKEVPLKEIYKKAHVLSIHLPLSEETKEYIDKKLIADMNSPFYLINTSRGNHVVIEDLIEGLQENKILGVGLDVLPNESHNFNIDWNQKNKSSIEFLMNSNKVIITPHVAGITKDAFLKMAQITADKIINFYEKKN